MTMTRLQYKILAINRSAYGRQFIWLQSLFVFSIEVGSTFQQNSVKKNASKLFKTISTEKAECPVAKL
jgi:hypothetical protein